MYTFNFSVSAIDILLIFAGLIVLIYCITRIFRRSEGKSKSEPAAQATNEVQTVATQTTAVQANAFQGISPEVVAAITAAIATVWQGEQGFVVRHIKRINNAPAWNRAGREEQTYSRF